MKAIKYFFIILSFLAVSCGEEAKDNQEGQVQNTNTATLVEVIVVENQSLNEVVNATGNILANESVRLTTETPGIVRAIHFEEGEEVKQGQLLVELDNRDLQAELNEIQTQIKLAEEKKSRAEGLFEAKGISQENLDEISTNVESLKAQRSRIQANVNKTRIVAPFSGIIGLRNVSEGGYVSANDNVANIVDITPLKIEFALPAKYQSAMKVGNKIEFTTTSQPGTMTAEIYAIEPMINPSSRTITARAKFPNEQKQLYPGGFADVTFRIKTFDESISIPNQAVIPEMDGKKVLLVENGKIKAQPITTGIRMADYIQVIQGLNEGDSVVTTGMLQVKEGAEVRTRADVVHQSSNKETGSTKDTNSTSNE